MPDQQQTANATAKADTTAYLSAVFADDMDALHRLILACDDPRLVLAGVGGFLAEIVPAWAAELGIDDLRDRWARLALEWSLEDTGGRL